MLRSRFALAPVILLIFGGCNQGPESATTMPEETEPVAETEASSAIDPSPVGPSRPELNLDERGRALRGYDPVAYFLEDRAIPGDDALRETWDGAEYMFATEAHRDAFVAQPERFLPSNGGFCTFGIVLEKKFDGDPEVWMVRDDQLHVFLNEEVRDKFLSDEASNFARVEANWPRIQNRTAEELEEASVSGVGSES